MESPAVNGSAPHWTLQGLMFFPALAAWQNLSLAGRPKPLSSKRKHVNRRGESGFPRRTEHLHGPPVQFNPIQSNPVQSNPRIRESANPQIRHSTDADADAIDSIATRDSERDRAGRTAPCAASMSIAPATPRPHR